MSNAVPQSVIAGQSYAVEVFGCRRILPQQSSIASFGKLAFFTTPTLVTHEFNDLPDGVLPSNKGGTITGIFARRADNFLALDTTAKVEAANLLWLDLMDALRVEIIVNNTLLAQQRLWSIPAAAPLIGGATSLATTKCMSVDNAGPILSMFELELPSSIPVRVEVSLSRPLTASPIADNGLTIGLQCKTSTLFTARR